MILSGNEDLRVVKTKKILFETLLNLMKTKNFEKIKISDICEESLINRSTFYAHYEDKYELLIELLELQPTRVRQIINNNVINIFFILAIYQALKLHLYKTNF